MSETKPRHYYIWVKVFDSCDETNNVEFEAEELMPEGLLKPRLIKRPPRFANNEKTCFWHFDPDFDGVKTSGSNAAGARAPNLKLDYSPHTGTRQQSIEWLECSAGKTWLAGAISFELLSFATL